MFKLTTPHHGLQNSSYNHASSLSFRVLPEEAPYCAGSCPYPAGPWEPTSDCIDWREARCWSATDSRDSRPLPPPPVLSGLVESLARDRRSCSTAPRPYSGSFGTPPGRTAPADVPVPPPPLPAPPPPPPPPSSLVTELRDSRDSLRLSPVSYLPP
uniref:Uncharacterized protein n=1 Tax=Anopheles atroparvus TaxID=41427 RepID=A0A182IYI3_ANOAO